MSMLAVTGDRTQQMKRFLHSFDNRFDACHMPEPNTGCWLWFGKRSPKRYGQIKFDGKTLGAHRVAYERFVGPIGDQCVLHRCDTPECVNPDHLFLGTQTDNMADMMAKGRMSPPPRRSGEGHHRAILTDAKVRDIRCRLSSGHRSSDLATEFGVSQVSINRAARGATWSHVK